MTTSQTGATTVNRPVEWSNRRSVPGGVISDYVTLCGRGRITTTDIRDTRPYGEAHCYVCVYVDGKQTHCQWDLPLWKAQSFAESLINQRDAPCDVWS